MSSSSGLARPRPGLVTRVAAFLLILAAGAWAATVALVRGMAGMTGTMGLGLAAFVPVWTLMMAAMRLPSVSPTASLYARTIEAWWRVPAEGPGAEDGPDRAAGSSPATAYQILSADAPPA